MVRDTITGLLVAGLVSIAPEIGVKAETFEAVSRSSSFPSSETESLGRIVEWCAQHAGVVTEDSTLTTYIEGRIIIVDGSRLVRDTFIDCMKGQGYGRFAGAAGDAQGGG